MDTVAEVAAKLHVGHDAIRSAAREIGLRKPGETGWWSFDEGQVRQIEHYLRIKQNRSLKRLRRGKGLSITEKLEARQLGLDVTR